MSKIDERIKRYSLMNEGEVSFDIFLEYLDYYLNIPTDEREKDPSSFSKAFTELVTKFDYKHLEEDTAKVNLLLQKMVSFIPAVTIGGYQYKEASFAFLYFLRTISSPIDITPNSDLELITKEYELFIPIVQKVKWLFQFTNDSGSKVFNISLILSNTITNFKLDNNHLMQIAFALQIFNISAISGDEVEQVKSKILEIAETNNVCILKYLCEGGKLLSANPVNNFNENEVFICQKDKSILIRSTNKSYFELIEDDKIDTEVSLETNEAIAYFHIYELEGTQEIISFEEALCKFSDKDKLMLLNNIFKQRNFNIFNDAIVYNTHNNNFCSFVNPCSALDKKIILKSTPNYKNNINGFIEVINTDFSSCRSIPLYSPSSFNILTLDFLLVFLLKVAKDETTFFEKFVATIGEDGSTLFSDFAQNILIKNYFDIIKDNLPQKEYYSKLLVYHEEFIMNYLKFNKEEEIHIKTKHSKEQALIYPYKFYYPIDTFDAFENSYKLNINDKKTSYSDLKLGKIEKGKKSAGEQLYRIENTSIDITSFSIEGSEDESTSISKLVTRQVFYSQAAKKIIYDANYTKFKNSVETILEFQKLFNLEYNQTLINSGSFKKVLNIISAIGMSGKVFEYIRYPQNNPFKSIEAYKLLWHFHLYNFYEDDKINKFFELVLEKHHSNFLFENSIYEKYIEEVEEVYTQEDCLLIAKNDATDGSTLKYILEKYKYGSDKSIFNLIHTNEGIQTQFRKYSDVNEVKKIYFLTDNIISGSSTKDMLKKYLGIKSNPTKLIFIKLSPNILLENSEYIKSCDINILSIFTSTNITDDVFANDFKDYNIQIKRIEQIDFSEFVCSEEVKNLVKSLYGLDTTSSVGKHLCFFRQINMPAKTVFPKEVCDTSNIIGLFERRGEIENI